MPRKKSTDDLIRVHLMLPREDWEFIKLQFGAKMKPSEVVRLIINNTLKTLRAKADAAAAPVQDDESLDLV